MHVFPQFLLLLQVLSAEIEVLLALGELDGALIEQTFRDAQLLTEEFLCSPVVAAHVVRSGG